MHEANRKTSYVMEKLKEGPWKTTLHMKKIMERFRKHAEEDIKIVTATAVRTLH